MSMRRGFWNQAAPGDTIHSIFLIVMRLPNGKPSTQRETIYATGNWAIQRETSYTTGGVEGLISPGGGFVTHLEDLEGL